MKPRIRTLLVSSSVSALSAFVAAQAADPSPTPLAQAETNDALTEIVVTARRKEEDLEDVPLTITPLTATDLDSLNVLRLQDIGEVASGVQISSNSLGSSVSMRGVTFNETSQTAPTVSEYINDAPVQAASIFQSFYDIGQVEVLKGPQGTTRGVAAPSGAITLTTRRPDLQALGAYGEVTISNQDERNVQGGLSLPLISDKLGIRVAGLVDQNAADFVHSVNSAVQPSSKTESARVSLRFEPTDDISANVMYQHLTRKDATFGGGEFGPGGSGGPDAPPNYNGPPLGKFDRLSAASIVSQANTTVEFVTGQFDWNFAGQRLSYIGSWSYFDTVSTGEDGTGFSGANTLPNFVSSYHLETPDNTNTHELRLQSVERVARIFDYVVGGYHSNDHIDVSDNNGPALALPGMFGSPSGTPSPYGANGRYALNIFTGAPSITKETDAFANITAHLNDRFEISAGTRWISESISVSNTFNLLPGYTAVALPAAFCTPAGGQFGATYPGICDIPVPGQALLAPVNSSIANHHFIWDASASYHITPELMAYVHAGSSFLPGKYVGIGVQNGDNNPQISRLMQLSPETSDSYEGGVKWSFLDRRGRLNVAYYHQIFHGFFYSLPYDVYYDTGVPGPNRVSQHEFSANVPAKVDGVDADLAMDILKQWSVQGNVAWAHSKLSGSIPCNSSKFNGVPDTVVPPPDGSTFIAAGQAVAYCPSSAAISTAPAWNFNIQSEYHLRILPQADGFIRGLFTYQPSDPNTSLTYTVPAYGLFNLYFGARAPDGSWEVTLFGKNIANTQKVLALNPNQTQPFLAGQTAALFGTSGYTAVTLTAPRELGLTVRFAVGSH